MKKHVTQTILIATSLCLWHTAQAQPPASAPSALAIVAHSPSIQDAELFSSLVQSDIATRQKLLKAEIYALEKSLRESESSANASLQKVENERRTHLEVTLQKLLTPETPALAGAEARFQLATLQQSENPAAALALLETAFSLVEPIAEQNSLLAANISLSAAELYLQEKKIENAKRALKRAIQISHSSTLVAQEIHLRSLVRLGDVHFEEYQFENSEKYYKLAEKIIQNAPFSIRESMEAFTGPVIIRRFWAQFRSGDYTQSVQTALRFANDRPLFPAELSPRILQDLVRSTGIALAEIDTHQKEIALKIAESRIAGELGKAMIVAGMQALLQSGRLNELETIALTVDSRFSRSEHLMRFLELRWEAAKQGDKPLLAQSIATLIAERLYHASEWRKAHIPQTATEKNRAELVNRAATVASELAYQEGRKTGSPMAYHRAYQFAQIQLQEPTNDAQRGRLLLHAGHLALLAQNPEAAENATREALTRLRDANSRKAALHQLVTATERRSANNETALANYLQAVDAFSRGFPEDPSARIALFESARKQEARKNFSDSRLRLERLLASATPTSPFTTPEKERVTLALLNINARDADTARATVAIGDLERQIAPENFSKEGVLEIQRASVATIKAHAQKLRDGGKILDAAHAEFLWGNEHSKNPQTPFVLRDAARSYFELGESGKAQQAAALVLHRYPRHRVRHEVLYWNGRAQELELAFSNAANTYVAAAYENNTSLSKLRRLDALSRANTILAELGNKAQSAQVLERIQALTPVSSNPSQNAQQVLSFATAYRDAGNTSQAIAHFRGVMENTDLSPLLRWKAEFELLKTRIIAGQDTEKNRLKLDDLLTHIAAIKSKQGQEERAQLLSATVVFALETDLAELTERPLHWTSAPHAEGPRSISRIEDLATHAFETLQNSKSSHQLQTSSLLLAQIRQRAAEWFGTAAASTANSSPQLSDTYAMAAERYRITARKVLFTGLSKENAERSLAAVTLNNLGSPTNLRLEPQLAVVEPANHSSYDVVRTVIETRTRQGETP